MNSTKNILEYFNKIFDDTIKDEKNDLFNTLLKQHGIDMIEKICKLLNYKDVDKLRIIANKSTNIQVATLVLACKKDNKSYIYVEYKKPHAIAVYVDKHYYIINNRKKAISIYHNYIKDGWTIIPNEELGIIINKNTKREVSGFKFLKIIKIGLISTTILYCLVKLNGM
jgi:hypothetical protein